MNNYRIKMLNNASDDLEAIYYYIKNQYQEVLLAKKVINDIEEAIKSLKHFPYRCATRKTGRFKNKKYRQLLVRNFIVIYKIDEINKTVIVVTIRYKFNDF